MICHFDCIGLSLCIFSVSVIFIPTGPPSLTLLYFLCHHSQQEQFFPNFVNSIYRWFHNSYYLSIVGITSDSSLHTFSSVNLFPTNSFIVSSLLVRFSTMISYSLTVYSRIDEKIFNQELLSLTVVSRYRLGLRNKKGIVEILHTSILKPMW